ncbi:MAG: hypothetical protein QXL54_03525 [Candidatus Bathyarchaeia archaeon]
MSCRNGSCELSENPSRGSSYKLKCENCGYEMPLADKILCPKCRKGMLLWTPKQVRR